MDTSHPLSISLCEVVVDGDDMNALSLQRIQIGRTGGYEGLTFTGSHLSDTALVKNDTTDQLYREVLHLIDTPCGLTYCRIGLRKNLIQTLSLRQTLLKLRGLRL